MTQFNKHADRERIENVIHRLDSLSRDSAITAENRQQVRQCIQTLVAAMPQTAEERILAAIRDGNNSAADISYETHLHPITVHRTLKRLVNHHRLSVTKEKRGEQTKPRFLYFEN